MMKKDDIPVVVVMGGIGLILTIIAVSAESTIAKVIWGLLAIGMIGLTIYGIIDSIIKSRRKPKDFADIFGEVLKEHMSQPDFAKNYEKRTEEYYSKKEQIFAGQRPNDDDYGYSKSNPIMTANVFRNDEYLKRLRTPDGKAFTWERNGSYCMNEISGVSNVMVDEYQLFLEGKPYKLVYICPKGFDSTNAPKGMQLID